MFSVLKFLSSLIDSNVLPTSVNAFKSGWDFVFYTEHVAQAPFSVIFGIRSVALMFFKVLCYYT